MAGFFDKDPNKSSLGKPTSTIEVDGSYLSAAITTHFGQSVTVHLSDIKHYKLCSQADIKRFLKQDATNKAKYVPERHDCDDFSYRLMGQMSIPGWSDLAFGIVWTDKHALNCFIDEDNRFWFVEPQTDEILPALKGWMGTTIRFIMM